MNGLTAYDYLLEFYGYESAKNSYLEGYPGNEN